MALDPLRREEIEELVRRQPYLQLLGVELAALAPGYAKMRLPITERLANIYAGLHGGALSSLADTAVAQALRTLVGAQARTTTVELNITYLSGTTEGEVIAEARILRQGKTLAVGEVDLHDGKGKALARARVTYMIVAS
ncbi:MAG: PaaI family thioesterase [Dehalococcoidia bacterium]|nr:PaaI family thioesterase [Dehalococcoidia bacterium]